MKVSEEKGGERRSGGDGALRSWGRREN